MDRLVDAIGLQAGVVVTGEDLHVRGGRAGELATTLAGVSLNEPGRHVAMEVPLLALRSAELLAGGLDADHQGSLSGELDLQTEVPFERPQYMVRWVSDGRYGSGFDAGHVRFSTPVGVAGLGLVAAGEARLDDLGLPSLRSRGRDKLLGGSFGWRQDNHLLAWAKLAPIASPQRASLEVLSQRVIRQPYDPMWSFDGWTYFEYVDVPAPNGSGGGPGAESVTDGLGTGYWARYRAADHKCMTEEDRLAAVATASNGSTSLPLRLTLGYLRSRVLTSVGLRRSPDYITDVNRVMFGQYDTPGESPFLAIWGDEPYFRRAKTDRWSVRGDASRRFGVHHFARAGAAGWYEAMSLHEVDDAAPVVAGVDTERKWQAWAPGAAAWVQHRWEFSGLVWNGGLRAQWFDPGPQAKGAASRWSVSPRFGIAYPMSDRDAFSLSYSRTFQDPPRELLYENRTDNYDRRPLGNPDLVPSEVISWQAAIKHVLDPSWSLQISAFARNVYAEPGTANHQYRPFLYQLQYASVDDAHAQGLEFSLQRVLPGRQTIQLAYTFLNAFGTQSNLEGLAYGNTLGPRPMPTGERPLDWDLAHVFTFGAAVHTIRQYDLSWATRIATGRPWTPLYRESTDQSEWPPAYSDQGLVNANRMPWTENTDVALRFKPRLLRGGRMMLAVKNLFDNVHELNATLSGFPNSRINTLYDEYSAYRTETGHGGGAYWNDANGDGVREWVPVNDPRLRAPRRSLRVGIEFGM
ncbi:MAG: TonB-dependent receptor [Candidatus Eisenbacteria bacterium]